MARKAKGANYKLSSAEKALIDIVTVIIAMAALAWLYANGIGLLNRWLLAILALLISGLVISKANGLKSMYGAYMLGSKHGIAFIDRLARHSKRFWIEMADWGMVVSLGLLAYPLFKKQIGIKTYALGIATIAVLIFFVLPYMSVALQLINIPQVNERIVTSSVQQTGFDYPYYATLALTFAIGMAALVVFTIFYNAGEILYGIATYLASLQTAHANTAAVSTLVPGVAPVIPFITIAGFAGIAALAVLLIIHEFSHGILARISKVKLKSIGLLVFGIIPLGAFVEPEEKEVKKLDKASKERIFIAGVASNFLATFVFFALMLLFAYFILPSFVATKVIVTATAPGSPAYNAIPVGAQILSWNGHAIKNLSSFATAAANDTPFSRISVVTNESNNVLTANSTGKIGVYLQQVSGPIKKGFSSNAVFFIYTTISLSFLLNFLVAIANLLPIPGFDGWQVYRTRVKTARYLNILAVLILAALVANALPWIWI